MTEKRLIFLSNTEARTAPYLVVDGAGGVFARGVLVPGDDNEGPAAILVVPGAEILARWIDLPHCTPAQAAAAAAIMLEDTLGTPRADTHIALGEGDDGRRIACLVDMTRMQFYLDFAAVLGVVPDAIVPDYLLLPPRAETALGLAMGEQMAVRGKDFAFSGEADLVSYIVGDRPVEWVTDMAERDRLLSLGAGALSLNLLQQGFAPRTSWRAFLRGHRRIAALAAAVLLSPIVLSLAQFARNEIGASLLEGRAETVAAAALAPQRVDDPVSYLQGRAADARASENFLLSTAALFHAVSLVEGTELESLTYLRDGVLQASVVHGSAQSIDQLRVSLADAGLVADADAAIETGDRQLTRLTVRLGS